MPVGSPLDTHGCDWCMLSRYARGINTTRITAAFTFGDLLHHLPTPPMGLLSQALRPNVPCLPLFSNQNTNFLRSWVGWKRERERERESFVWEKCETKTVLKTEILHLNASHPYKKQPLETIFDEFKCKSADMWLRNEILVRSNTNNDR